MRVRISSFIFGLAIVFATFILLYQVFSLPADSQPPSKRKQEDVALLESRLRRLEEDISSNHDTIKEIKKLIKSLSNSVSNTNLLIETPVLAKLKPNANKYDRGTLKSEFDKSNLLPPIFNLTKGSIHQDDCIFSQSPPSTVDIQMKDVYDLLPFDNQDGGSWKQGWNIQYDTSQWTPENKLKVFVVPHSHNDPGWIKTFEKYFEDQTRHIFDNMVVKLSEDHRRKFIWAEISYFALWWDRQSMEVKDAVKRLVESGQFEIVTGGWVMPDEAVSHYYSLVDQLLTGHEWLQLNLGVKPSNGWAIDPFGMSPTMAYLLKRSGFQNMLIQRTHYSVKKHLAKEKSLEFHWRQIWDSETSTDILCHMMPFYSYDVPHTCGPDPKVCCQFDFRRLPGSGVTCPWRISPMPINIHNVESRVSILLDQYRKKSQLYKTNVVLIPLGDDFRFDKANEWDSQFENYQKLFDHMNSKEDLNVQAQFGTLADYFRALREEVTKSNSNVDSFFPTLSGDFFSYADRDDHYWTGYFTSRPFYKRMDRILQSYIRSAEILFSLMLETETQSGWGRNQQDIVYSLMDNLVQARRNFGLFQHHDAITGTSKNHVVIDYANRLLSAIRTSQHIIQLAAHSLLSQNQQATGEEESTSVYFEMGEQFAQYNNVAEKTVLKVVTGTSNTMFIFNPEAHKRQQLFTVRVDSPYIEVIDRSGEMVTCQVEPLFSSDGETVLNQYNIHFVVSLDALSLTSYTIKGVELADIKPGHTSFSTVEYRNMELQVIPEIFQIVPTQKTPMPIYLNVGHISANFSADGLLQHVTTNSQSMDVNLEFIKYNAGVGGAYLFLPKNEAQVITIKNNPLIVVQGPLRASVIVMHKHMLQHKVILKNSPGVDGLSLEIDNYVNVKNEKNIELGMRLTTSIKNDNIFYTDLNGFQVIKRVRYAKLPTQGNFYPLPTQMFLEDQNARLSLLSAQPLGCASLQEGQMEVILDRQLTQDDERGLGQGVYDNVLTLNKFQLLLENRIKLQETLIKEDIPSGYPSMVSHATISLLLHPSLQLQPVVTNHGFSKHWSIGGELPCDVELVNLRSLTASRQPGAPHPPSSTMALTLHRLAFSCSFPTYGVSCSTNNGKVRLADLFPASFSDEVKQMSLSHLYEGVDMSKSYTLSLHPMELYSFKLFISSVN